MKKLLFIGLLIGGFGHLHAQNETEIIGKLQAVCGNMDSIRSPMSWKKVQAEIDAVKKQYPSSWIPAYYSAYSAINQSYFLTDIDMRDYILDVAESNVAVLEENCPLKDEVFVIKAMIANARLSVDPAKRFKEFGAAFETNLAAAKAVNPNNPHIYFAKGNSVLYTPKMFGGGGANALPYYEKAKANFDAMSNLQLNQPYWGKFMVEFMIAECKK